MTMLAPSVEELAARIPDGASLVICKEPYAPMALVRALIARQARGLHLVTAPTAGLPADALIGAGCIGVIETSGVSLGEFGPAPFFGEAVKAGAIEIRDSTCPAVYAGLQAGEKGVPFMPIRGLLGSDVLASRADYKVIDNPFEAGDPIVLLPAIRPDFALIHAPEADRFGNVWVGGRHECKTAAHAAKATLATAERIVDGRLTDDPAKAPNLVTALYVEAIAEAEGGAWPLAAAPPAYGVDAGALRAYAAAARDASRGGSADWLALLSPPTRIAAE